MKNHLAITNAEYWSIMLFPCTSLCSIETIRTGVYSHGPTDWSARSFSSWVNFRRPPSASQPSSVPPTHPPSFFRHFEPWVFLWPLRQSPFWVLLSSTSWHWLSDTSARVESYICRCVDGLVIGACAHKYWKSVHICNIQAFLLNGFPTASLHVLGLPHPTFWDTPYTMSKASHRAP